MLGNGPGDAALTLDEAINILEREHSVHKTDADQHRLKCCTISKVS